MQEQTIYISYRPSESLPVAQMLFNGLAQIGCDVYMDIADRVDSVNLRQITAREHFIMMLTPGVVAMAQDPADRLALEFEKALAHKRNIIVLMTKDTDLPDELAQVEGVLTNLAAMPTLRIHVKHIRQVIEHLAEDFLMQSADAPILTPPPEDEAVVQERMLAANRYTKEVTVRLNTEKALFEAVAKIRQGDYEAALHELDMVIAENPQNESAYLQRGRVLRRLGRITAALRDYERAASLSPKMTAAQIGLGELLLETERYNRALEAFEMALTVQETSSPAIAGQALAVYGLGDTEQAVQMWQQLTERDANYADPQWVKEVFNWSDPILRQAKNLLGHMSLD